GTGPISLVVVGSCMIDLVSYVPRLPRPGETIHGTKFQQGFGGKGANQCVAAAKLGASTALVAKLGKDKFGDSYLTELATCSNINTRYVHRAEDNVSSGIATICVSNTVTTMINVAPAPADSSPELLTSLSLASIVCVNEIEAEMLTQIPPEPHTTACVEKLLDLGCERVILTLGGKGAVFATAEDRRVRTVGVDTVDHPVDTTGAGDCFLGALSYYLSYFPSLPLGEQISRACKIARLSVMQYGTQDSFPCCSDLEKGLVSASSQYFQG
ncbi:ribokinase-like, partial [Diaphorina citri]|uniref:Ribokinase n=1 Tax=Diaphorina citri TaxID=121845 RepID=A0A3Q0JAA9_DIACI